MNSYRNPGSPNAGYNPNFVGAGYGGQQTPQVIQNHDPGQYTEDFYTYSVTIATLAAAGVNNQNFVIQADSDFEWVMTTVSGNINGVTEPAADNIILPITVSITDSGSGRQLSSIPMPLSGIAGNGKQPFIMPVPRRFMAKSTVSLVFTNYGGSQYNNIFLNFIGRKIFDVTRR